MPNEPYDLFNQPPPNLARCHNMNELSTTGKPWDPPKNGHELFMAAQELVHSVSYMKLNDWQQKYMWPHLKVLLERMQKEERLDIRWFELGYIISALELSLIHI